MKILQPNVLQLFSILLLCLPITIYSQKYFEGYYITNEKDTVRGWIGDRGNRMNSSICYFKSDKKAKLQRLVPNSIQGYGFGSDPGNKYLAEEVEIEVQQPDNKKIKQKEKKFLKVLIQGELSLYSIRSRKDKTIYFLDKSDLGVTQIPPHKTVKGDTIIENRSYIGILRTYTTDCLISKQKAVAANFTERDFIEVVLSYNKSHQYPFYLFQYRSFCRKL